MEVSGSIARQKHRTGQGARLLVTHAFPNRSFSLTDIMMQPEMISLLPQELTDAIAIYLNAASLRALRLTCRVLNDKIFRSWVKCLHTIQTDLGPQSLTKLLAISKNKSVREHVYGLYVRNPGMEGRLGVGLQWSHDQYGSLLLSRPNERFQLFQKCLCNDLKNCRSFYIHGFSDDDQSPEAVTITQVVMLFLNMIAETGLEIRSFGVDLTGEHPTSYCTGNGCVHAPRMRDYFTLRHQPLFEQGWRHLRELHLHQDIGVSNVIWTRDLIQRATNLRSLSIKFYRHASTLNNKILDLNIPSLEALYIRFTDLTAIKLVDFLYGSRQTLQRLKLCSIYLGWDGRADDGRLREWKYFFRILRTDFPKLRRIDLFPVYAACARDARSSRCSFQALLEDNGRLNDALPDEKFKLPLRGRSGIIRCVSYEGHHMASALERLEEAVEYV